jgi:hypothetical protein
MTKWHGGKGSERRKGADQKKYAEGWDAIFGKKKEPEEPEDRDLKFTTAGEYMGDVKKDEKSG